jgi:putative transposase
MLEPRRHDPPCHIAALSRGSNLRQTSLGYPDDASRLAQAGVEPFVGSVGDSYDNALAETINGLFITEVIHRRSPWRSFEAVEFGTLERVDWFITRRLLEPMEISLPPRPKRATKAQSEVQTLAA